MIDASRWALGAKGRSREIRYKNCVDKARRYRDTGTLHAPHRHIRHLAMRSLRREACVWLRPARARPEGRFHPLSIDLSK
jgi:hypothetical protein